MKKSLLLAGLIVGVVSVVMNPMFATGAHEPADKASAAAHEMDTVSDVPETVLRQTMRVSSTSDLILQTTAECSILTDVLTNNAQNESGAFGQVEMWIEIDGNRIPVATANSDNGEVVFCNRAHARSVEDREEPRDGIDTEEDFIRTRTANAFNWMAFNVGATYDETNVPAGTGNNVVDIQLKAAYTKTPNECAGTRNADDALGSFKRATCADAWVGNRTLIAEAVHASNHEQPDDGLE